MRENSFLLDLISCYVYRMSHKRRNTDDVVDEAEARKLMKAYMEKKGDEDEEVDARRTWCCHRNCLNSISKDSHRKVSDLFEWRTTTVANSSASGVVVATSHEDKLGLLQGLLSDAISLNAYDLSFNFSAAGIENNVCEQAAQYMLGKWVVVFLLYIINSEHRCL